MIIGHPKIHNILPAFRGPDKAREHKYKIITVAIRSYLGFTPETFKGQLLKKGDYVKYCKAMSRLTAVKHKTHYQKHLLSAVKAIGPIEILRFVRTVDNRKNNIEFMSVD